jgi:hypothetical protein
MTRLLRALAPASTCHPLRRRDGQRRDRAALLREERVDRAAVMIFAGAATTACLISAPRTVEGRTSPAAAMMKLRCS